MYRFSFVVAFISIATFFTSMSAAEAQTRLSFNSSGGIVVKKPFYKTRTRYVPVRRTRTYFVRKRVCSRCGRVRTVYRKVRRARTVYVPVRRRYRQYRTVEVLE